MQFRWKSLPVCVLAVGLMAGCSSSASWPAITVEAGQALDEEYLKSQNIDLQGGELSDEFLEEGWETLLPGEYEIPVLKNGKQTGTLSVTVQDTKQPVFKRTTRIVKIPVGSDSLAIEDYFSVEDGSPVTFAVNVEPEELQTPGDYDLSVTATDSAGNSASRDFVLRVLQEDGSRADQTESSTHTASGTETDSEEENADAPGTIRKGILIVNKKHPLSADYNPGEDPEAKAALLELIADMRAAGLSVSDAYSGFRTYQTQEGLYNNYAASYGTAEADTFSARPGYSEHQTGQTFDLKLPSGELITTPAESQWLLDHCADYGFIIRYPLGKESITGYDHEPWHLRYVGKEHAEKIMSQGLTLEEYLDVEGGDYAG